MRRLCLLALVAACDRPARPPADPVAPPTTVRASLRGDGDPSLFAYRDGDGAWTELAPSDRVFTFEVRSGRFEVAYACRLGQGRWVVVYALTVRDMTSLPVPACGSTGQGVTVSGIVTGVSAGARAVVVVTFFPTDVGEDGGFRDYVSAGEADVVVLEGDGDPLGRELGWSTRRVSITRMTPVEGIPLAIDLGISGVELEHRELTIRGTDADEKVVVRSRVDTAHQAHPLLTVDREAPYVADVLPPSLLAAGDASRVDVTAEAEGRTRTAWGPGPEYELMAPLGAVSVAAGGGGSMRFTWPPHRDAKSYDVRIFDVMGMSSYWAVVSSDWLQDADVLEFEMPEIALPGWDAFAFRHDGTVDWFLAAQDSVVIFEDPAADESGRSSARTGHFRIP